MNKFDPEKFGERVAVRVKQAMADAIRPLEARISQLEADCAALLDNLSRDRRQVGDRIFGAQSVRAEERC